MTTGFISFTLSLLSEFSLDNAGADLFKILPLLLSNDPCSFLCKRYGDSDGGGYGDGGGSVQRQQVVVVEVGGGEISAIKRKNNK